MCRSGLDGQPLYAIRANVAQVILNLYDVSVCACFMFSVCLRVLSMYVYAPNINAISTSSFLKSGDYYHVANREPLNMFLF